MKKPKIKIVPHPGSKEAIKLHCSCPVMDNENGGGFIMGGVRCWWQSEDCPLHGRLNRFDQRGEG